MASDENYRRHERIREEIPVRWRIDRSERSGEGLIRDISVSGVLLEMNTFVTPDKSSVFILESAQAQDELVIPDRSRLVWSKAMKMEVGKYLCGLEFIKPPDSAVAKIAYKVETWLSGIAGTVDVNILKNYFSDRDRR